MNILLLFALLSSYQVGDTAQAQIQRIGGVLETVPTTAVCVYSDSNYNIFSVYENSKVTSIINTQGNLITATVAGEKTYECNNWLTKREWMNLNENISSDVYKSIFIKTQPITYSRFYFLADFFFQRGEGAIVESLKTFVVVDPSLNDTAKPIYNLDFHPVYQDSLLYVSSGTGVFLGIGISDSLSPAPFYRWNWQKLGDIGRPVYDVYVVNTNFILAGTDSGIYAWDGSNWNKKLSDGVTVHGFFMNPDSSTLYAATSGGIYSSADNGNSWSLYGLSGKETTVIRFKVDTLSGEDTLFIGTKGEGIFKNPEGSSDFEDFSHGIEDRFYSKIGGLNINDLLVYSNSVFFAGTDCGLFAWFGERWVNIAGNTSLSSVSTLGLNLSTEVIDSAIELINEDFEEVYDAVTRTIVDSFEVPENRIYPDFDNDPVINILIALVHETVHLSNPSFYADYLPVIGYFNPADEDTTDTLLTLRDYFVLNVSNQTFRSNRFLGIDEPLRKKLIAFLLSRMAFWEADKGEALFVRTGLSMLNTFWALPDSVFHTSEGLLDGLEFADKYNYSLDQGSVTHAHATEMREVDRERLFLFTEYLYEKYGRQMIDTLAKDQRHGYTGLRYFIGLEGDSLEDFFREWAFANYYDDPATYGYKNVDVEIHPVIAGPRYDLEYLSPWSVFYFQSPGALAFNSNDDALFDIFRLRGEVTGPTEEVVDTLTMRFKIPADTVTRVWCLTNVVGNTYAFAYGQDLESPQPVYVYTVQNSVFNPSLDFFVFGYEILYSDVELNSPTVVLKNLNDSTENYEISTLLYAQGDSTYIYNGHSEIPGEGQYEVSLIAQDITGNDAIYKRDTIGILYLGPAGGTFSYFGGNLVIEYPENAVGSSCYISLDQLDARYFKLYGIENGIYTGYAVGSEKFTLNRPATISLKIPESIKSEDFGLFKLSQGTLKPIPYSIEKGGFAVANVNHLGIFVLANKKGLRIKSEPYLSPLIQRIYRKDSPMEITFSIPRKSNVKVRVFDVSGRLVENLYKGVAPSGIHTLSFSPDNISRGLYFLTLEIDGKLIKSEKFVLQ